MNVMKEVVLVSERELSYKHFRKEKQRPMNHIYVYIVTQFKTNINTAV